MTTCNRFFDFSATESNVHTDDGDILLDIEGLIVDAGIFNKIYFFSAASSENVLFTF